MWCQRFCSPRSIATPSRARRPRRRTSRRCKSHRVACFGMATWSAPCPERLARPDPQAQRGRLVRRDGTLRDEGRKQGSPHRTSPLAIHPWQSARPVDDSDRRVSINPGTVSALASSSTSCRVRGGRPFEVGARPLLLSITPVLSPRVARLRAPLLFPTIAFWPNRCWAERTRSVCDPAHTSLVVRVSIRNIIGPCGDGPSLSPSC